MDFFFTKNLYIYLYIDLDLFLMTNQGVTEARNKFPKVHGEETRLLIRVTLDHRIINHYSSITSSV